MYIYCYLQCDIQSFKEVCLMSGKLIEKKKQKLTKLYNAAYDLLTANGVHNTIVDDIVKNAGVAKGTFYLYFKDKSDLVDKVIIRKTSSLLNGALEALKQDALVDRNDFRQSVIFIANYLIDFFVNDKKFLELIHANLSINLYHRLMDCEEMVFAREQFISSYVRTSGSAEGAHRKLFIITSLICSVCYNTIALEFPYRFEEVKGDLYDSIDKILSV